MQLEESFQKQEAPVSANNRFNWKRTAIIIVITTLLAGTGGYLLRASQNALQSMQKASFQPSSTITPQHSPVPQSTYNPDSAVASRVPADWSFIKSDACNVVFPLPPKKTPYYYPYDPTISRKPFSLDDIGSGRYWRFEEYDDVMFDTESTASVYLIADDEGGGEGCVRKLL